MPQKDYSKLEKDDLLKVIEKLESRKKYGLIWDEEKTKEKFEKDAENALPVLKEVKSKEITDKDKFKPVNIFIEGDNYHALSVLNFTHQGKIDVIYIDPPYNTGANDWKYNNDYVDINDTFRHSKWLSMMNNRLRLAKHLLKEDGILICAIDDNEFATLNLLLDEIFPEKVKNTVVIVNNPHGVAKSGFSRCHEYAIFLLNPGQTVNKKPAPEDIRKINLRRSGNNSLRADSPTMFYPIFIDKKTLKIIGAGQTPDEKFHPGKQMIEKNNCYELWPIDSKGVEKNWYYSRKRVIERGDKELECKNENGQFRVFFHHSNNSEQTYKSVWISSEYDAGSYGATLVKNLTKNNFPFPKSINTVVDCLKSVIKTKDAIILDFFAGSGTTGHAVSILNKEDGGNRQFILCTNNENLIAEKVCYPRIKAVIKGHKDYSDITGVPSNLKYFKTAFVKNTPNKDESKIRLTKECTEMLCLREGVFDEVKKTPDYRIFKQGDKILAVYYSLERKTISNLKKELDKMTGDKIIYCFTLDPIGLDKSDFIGWDDVSLEPIPQKILDVYKQIYEY